MPLREFLDQIRAPVAVVDAQGIIRAVNKAGRTLVGKTSAQTDGLPGGNIFECEYSHLPEGCGKTAHCSGCAIRNTVMDTHRSGRSHSHVTANLRQRQTAGTQDLRLQISTEKVNEVVLLRVDEIKPK